jgi:type 1 glutamine amidotransferase
MTRREMLGFWAAARLLGQGVARERPARKPYVVLVSGETGYQSDRTLADFAQELESHHGARCNLLVASGKDDLPGLEVLEDASVTVLFLQSLVLPASQLSQIRAYVEAGKPLVALRGTLRGFDNWKEFGPEVLGAAWRYDYGSASSTDVKVIPEAAREPILEGVAPEFHCRSWLYHVLPLSGSVKPLLMGTPVGPSDRAERVPNPVAWTRTRKGGRVFYTSLGHPDDFQVEPFRRLLANAVQWALAR